jgi:hypothetical protein
MASASAVNPSANSAVTGSVDALAACRNLLPALMGGNCIGPHRQAGRVRDSAQHMSSARHPGGLGGGPTYRCME